jgi:hypothetical protein
MSTSNSKNFLSNASNYYNSVQPWKKILLFVFVLVLFSLILYFGYNANKNNQKTLLGQTLIGDNILINSSTTGPSVSVNKSPSFNMSFSFWLNINDLTVTSTPDIYPLFAAQTTGTTPKNYVTVGVDTTTNNLKVQFLKQDNTTYMTTVLENIPIYTTSYYVITISGRYINIFLNGELVQSGLLADIPASIASNTFKVTCTPASGLSARIGKLYYFNRVLDMSDIATLVNDTPNFS